VAQCHDTRDVSNLQSALLDVPEFLRGIVETAVQRLLNGQFEAAVGAASYERNDDRKGYRNGIYTRSLKTRVEPIELQVPRDRDGRFCPTLFKAYERHTQAFQLALMERVLHGVSTRKVTDVVEALCGHSLSKGEEGVHSSAKAFQRVGKAALFAPHPPIPAIRVRRGGSYKGSSV
jgi:putative transposase